MDSNLSVLIIAHDIPYPPNHGGRVDMWNRIVALSNQGVTIHLITWTDNSINEEQKMKINERVKKSIFLKRKLGVKRFFHPTLPSGVITHSVNDKQYREILEMLSGEKIDIVFLDGILGVLLAQKLANTFNKPLVYRSHNVEYQYIKELFKAENNLLRKISKYLNIKKMENLERYLRINSNLVYDISEKDFNEWSTKLNQPNAKILNPMLIDNNNIYNGIYNKENEDEEDIDILYIGNLYSPNNVFGLTWFLEKVVPYLKDKSIVLAGAKPVKTLIELAHLNGVKVIADPPEVSSLYKRSKVLINPIWHGSGVNIKMIEMLSTGKPVVTTSKGINGLTKEASRYANVHDTPEQFANAIRNCLNKGKSREQIMSIVKDYSYENVLSLIKDLNQLQ